MYALAIDLVTNAISEIGISSLQSTNILKFYLSVIVTSVSLYLLFSFFKKGNPEELIKSFFWIISIQFAICLLMLLNQEIRDYINFSLITPQIKFASDGIKSTYDFRAGYGLATEQLFTYPLFNAWIACVSLFSYWKKNVYYLFFVPISLIPAFLNARVSVIFLPSFIFSFLLIEKKNFLNLDILVKVFASFSFLVFFLTFSFIQFINYIPEKTYFWIATGFSDFLKLISFGAINIFVGESNFGFGSSTDILLESHLFFPDNFLSLLLGEGIYIFGNKFSSVSSDIGYIRSIFFGGLIFLIAMSFVFIGFLLKIMSKTRNEIYQAILTSGILLILIGNVKGDIFANNALLRGVFLFGIFVLFDLNVNNTQCYSMSQNSIS